MVILLLSSSNPTEAATTDVSVKKVFLKVSQISQESTCVGVSF